MQRARVNEMNDYRAVLLNSTDKWGETGAAWNGLLSQSGADTIFLTWEWLFSWGENYLDADRSLFIVMVYKDDELVGIAPWYVQHLRKGALPIRQLRFLGAPEAGSDYLDVIVKKGQEQKVANFLHEFLLTEARDQWDACLLEDLPSNSLFLLHFQNAIEDAGKYAEIRPCSFCPTVVLPKKGVDLFSLYSANRRQQYRRHLKLLNNGGELRHETFTGERADGAFGAFCTLYETKNQFHDKSVRSFLSAYASRCGNEKALQVDLLSSNGKLIAGLLHLQHQGTLGMYLMAVDKEHHPHISLGNILLGMCLSKAIEDGVVVYDFLKGTEPYKFHWADQGRSSVTLSYYQKNVASLLLVAEKFLKYTAKVVLR
jgi:CelD/BcsL family acetyltransferase involved in cellulose biosynthesis